METRPAAPRPCASRAARAAQPQLALAFDRQRLQGLIDLLARYDLSSAATTDNSDLKAQLRAFGLANY